MKKITSIINNLYPVVILKRRKKYINFLWKNTKESEKIKMYNSYTKYKQKNCKMLEDVEPLLKDMLFMKNNYNFSYDEYFMFNFKHMILRKRKAFIPQFYMKEYISFLNDSEEKLKVLRDKYECYKKYKSFYKRDIISLDNQTDYKVFEDFCKNHSKIVKKPYNKAFGKGIELINVKDYKSIKAIFNYIMSESNNERVVIEELIVQDVQMKVLNPSSVNTIRIIPFIKKDGEIVIDNPFIKIGQNNSFVDNGGAGGMLALIDPKTGVIKTHAYDELRRKFKRHPNTNIKIKGFKIPRWDEAVELGKKLAPLNKKLRYVGWDIALTKKGWVVVEGNGATQFIGQQIADLKGKKKQFEDLIGYKIKIHKVAK